MMREKVCIVLNEREPSKLTAAEALEQQLEKDGISVKRLAPAPQIDSILAERCAPVLILDYLLGDYSTGLDVLAAVNQRPEEQRSAIVFYTDEPSVSVAVEALQSGAKDYIEIGSPHALTRAITKTKALLASRQRQQNILLPSYLLLSEITAQCTASIKLVAEARALAASPNPIKILCGPSGSGLSTLAHALRLAASKPWLCEEIDLRFFDRDFSALLPGTNKHAWRSTLGQNAYFICDKAEETENDELLDLVQKQRGRIWPAAGGSTVNCAAPYPGLIVITSSPKIAKSWQSLAKAEVLKVPGLEERRDDIPTLCQNFARQAAEWGGTNYKALRNEIVEKFYNHSWPGNLRQLRSAVFNWQAFASSQAQEQALEQALEISESPQAAEAHICAISAAEAAKVVEQAGGVWHMAAARIGLSVQALKSLVQGKDL